MARRLEAFPASASARYPWDQWLDGSPWELVRGEDFHSKLSTLGPTPRSRRASVAATPVARQSRPKTPATPSSFSSRGDSRCESARR